jgi:hypothetical protein
MDDNDDQTHPLDRDYSTTVATQSQGPVASHPSLLRTGVTVFAAGFIAVLLGGILVSNSPGNTWSETIGSFVHRAGMILILVGAVTIILAYRWAQLASLIRSAISATRISGMHAYVTLLFWNVVAYVTFVLLFYLVWLSRSPSVMFLFFNAMVTISFAFMITLTVWHRGFVRAYAIGVLASIVLNVLTGLIGFNGQYWRGDGGFLMLAHLATILICGLVCGGYVCLLESCGSPANGDANRESTTAARADRGD